MPTRAFQGRREVDLNSLAEDPRRVDEERSARLVGQLLELAGPFVGTASHHDRVPGTEPSSPSTRHS